MPGNVQISSPTDVMPFGLSAAFTEDCSWVALTNTYADGSFQGLALTGDSRKRWQITRALPPSDAMALRAFFLAHKVQPFYFYAPYDSGHLYGYDASGANPSGRHTVRFDSGLSVELRLGRSVLPFALIEIV